MSDDVASGLRVVEIGSSIAAATAGMVLADFGASVTVVEAPAGSRLRSEPAYPMWMRAKQIEAIDLEGDGRSRLTNLLADADVAIVALRPSTADRLGVDGTTLAAADPRLVHCEVTGFGRAHPLADIPGHEAVVACHGGRAHEFSVLFGGERPAFPAVPVATHGAAMLALQGIFAALYEREATGLGQRVETSLLRALGVYDLSGWTPGRVHALRTADVPSTIYPVLRTSDGIWVQFSQNAPRLYRAFLRALGLEHLYDDPRFATAPYLSDADDARALRTIQLDRLAERTWAEWDEVFDADPDLSAEPFLAPGDAFDHPQFVHNGDARAVETARGPRRQLGPLARVVPAAPSGPPRAADPDAPPLLDGVTVVEFASWIATPLAAGLFADLGARVIKIEPLDGDPFRMHGDVGMKCLQGKESIAVDLKSPEGVAIAQELAARADVLMHNYRPGVPERLGIDEATLRRRNPGLIHLYGGSYGSTGPMSARPAFHVTAGAICGGVVAQVGERGLPPAGDYLSADEAAWWSQFLSRCNESHPDFNAALALAAMAAMGLYARARTGAGAEIETRMMTSNAYTMSRWFGDEPVAVPDADLYGYGPLHRLYPAESGWVMLAVEAGDAARVLELTGAAGTDADSLGAAFATRDADEWQERFAAAGLACVRADAGPLWRNLEGQPWAETARMVAQSTEDGRGPYLRYDRPVSGEREPRPLGPADDAGAQTRALLAEIGRSEADIERLLGDGIVAEG